MSQNWHLPLGRKQTKMRANDLKRVVKVFRCESCDVVCTGPFPLDQHQRAAKHGPYALRKLQKNDEEIAALL